MNSAIDILKQDPHYLDQRRKELQPYLNYFSNQLFQIYCRMPAPTIVLDTKTGECERIVDKEWQELIDQIKMQQQEILEKEFPEFYKTISHE